MQWPEILDLSFGRSDRGGAVIRWVVPHQENYSL